MDKIKVIKDGEIIAERDVDCNLSIGRAEDNDIILPDTEKYVSRKHAKIEVREDGAYIMDTGSQNGIVIDGAKVQEAKLDGDTEINIGKFKINFIREKTEEGTMIMSKEKEEDDEEDAGTMIISKDKDPAPPEPVEEGTMVKAPKPAGNYPPPRVGRGEFELDSGHAVWIKYAAVSIALVIALGFIFFKRGYSIAFEVRPVGAQVYVNGIGMPVSGGGKLRKIKKGTYKIKITHPEYAQAITGNLELSGKERHLKVIVDSRGMEVTQ